MRVYCGICWPEETKPGALVALKEDFGEYKILGEAQDTAVEGLMRRAKELEALYRMVKFYGDRDNRAMLRLMQCSQHQITILKAPFTDSPKIYISLIRDKLSATNKLLTLGEHSKIPAILAAADFAHPRVVALGMALAAFTVYADKPRTYTPGHGVLDPIVGY